MMSFGESSGTKNSAIFGLWRHRRVSSRTLEIRENFNIKKKLLWTKLPNKPPVESTTASFHKRKAQKPPQHALSIISNSFFNSFNSFENWKNLSKKTQKNPIQKSNHIKNQKKKVEVIMVKITIAVEKTAKGRDRGGTRIIVPTKGECDFLYLKKTVWKMAERWIKNYTNWA
jgi:hypothetical protein